MNMFISFPTDIHYISFLSRESIESFRHGYVYEVPHYLDGVSSEIRIEGGVPFGGKVHYRAWVSQQLLNLPCIN